jgi:hypothetical protein
VGTSIWNDTLAGAQPRGGGGPCRPANPLQIEIKRRRNDTLAGAQPRGVGGGPCRPANPLQFEIKRRRNDTLAGAQPRGGGEVPAGLQTLFKSKLNDADFLVTMMLNVLLFFFFFCRNQPLKSVDVFLFKFLTSIIKILECLG